VPVNDHDFFDNLTLFHSVTQLVEGRLRSLPQTMLAVGADSSNQEQLEQLFLLRSKFTEIVADLLRILLLQVNAMNSGHVAVSGGPEAFCQNVAFLLDQTRLETPVSAFRCRFFFRFCSAQCKISIFVYFCCHRAYGDQMKTVLATL